MPTNENVELRCSAYRCDELVSVTDEEMSDPRWRRYHVHCPKHQLMKSRAQRKVVEAVNDKELEEELTQMEREMEAEPPQTGNMKRCHEVTRAMIAAARAGISEKPTALQAAWVLRNFADAEMRQCTFSRKVEIMYPDDGGALMALLQAGGQEISNEMFSADEYRKTLRRIKEVCVNKNATVTTLGAIHKMAEGVLDA